MSCFTCWAVAALRGGQEADRHLTVGCYIDVRAVNMLPLYDTSSEAGFLKCKSEPGLCLPLDLTNPFPRQA
jgi:hypothetical protein